MIRQLTCTAIVLSICLAGTTAFAAAPTPVLPGHEIAALGPQPEPPDLPSSLGVRALGPQPEPPDCSGGFMDWILNFFRGMLPR